MNIKSFAGVLAAAALMASCDGRTEVVANYDVIPLPQEIVYNQAEPEGFKLDRSTVISYPAGDSVMRRNAQFLAEYVKDLTGLSPKVTDSPASHHAIVLKSDLTNENPEAYELTVTPALITINGATPAGTFYGIQTLRKSVPEQGQLTVNFPAATISDAPRFSYRGAMLDTSRHFFPTDSMKKFIDMLALHNINRFHWHLSEDQGWRIEIKSRPKLTEVGSMRGGTCIGHDFNTSDSIPYGGFYTQEEARDIVRYAAERHITIIPEIDMPGHMLAALAAYPELGCTGGPYEVWHRWGVSQDVLCAGNDSVLAFIDDVLNEITDIFPSEYIHVGGDECPKVRWHDCPKCQAKARELGFKNDADGTVEEKLQSYIIKHAGNHLAERGRKMIGWDETLQGGLAPGATVMSWRGVDGAKEAARQGHDAIMTPTNFFYFDYYQTLNREGEPDAIGGYVPVEKVYSFNPVFDDLTPEENRHIIGVQANLWTEYIDNYPQVEYMELPRMAALAEVQWTAQDKRDYKDFGRRMPQLVNQYRNRGYRYATHMFEVSGSLEPDAERKVIVAELGTIDNAPVYYTLDGSEPTEDATLYEQPLELSESAVIKAVAIRPEGPGKVFADSININYATFKPIVLAEEPAPKYADKGASALVDGKFGGAAFNAGGWLGFYGADLDATIDLGEPTKVSSVSIRTNRDFASWVVDATGMSVAVSPDGKTFTTVATATYPETTSSEAAQIATHTLTFEPVEAKAVRVVVTGNRQMPGAKEGAAAWLFVDEIVIQ